LSGKEKREWKEIAMTKHPGAPAIIIGRRSAVQGAAAIAGAAALGMMPWGGKLAQASMNVELCNSICGTVMENDVRALRSLAQTYFDAAYEMDAEKFASIFHAASSVTKVGDDGNVSVTPIATWLAAVRKLTAPKQQGLERRDEIISIDVEGELALVKLKLQIPPRHFTDMLSCLKTKETWKIAQKVMTAKT
jgi:hypothetical protein